MKLEGCARNTGAGSYYFYSSRIDEKKHWRDKRRQAAGQLGGALKCHMARAGFVHNKADGICTGGYGGIDDFFAGQATDLDAGPVEREGGAHGSQS